VADDAGFAVAVTLRDSLLNNAILVAYANDDFPRTLNHAVLDGPPDADLDVFLGPPQLRCHTATGLTVTVPLWGALTVNLSGTPETATISASLTLALRPDYVVQGENLLVRLFRLDGGAAVTATAWDFTVIGGGFTSPADSYLHSDAFRTRLQSTIRGAVLQGAVSIPPISIKFLGDDLLRWVDDPQSRVVNNALLLGFDVNRVDDPDTDIDETLTTTGDVNQLADIAKDNDIAAATNKVAVPQLLQAVRDEVNSKLGGATLDKLEITARLGHFHVEGHASDTLGSMDFSFNLYPSYVAHKPGAFFRYLKRDVLVKPRTFPALVFSITDVQTDAHTVWWLDILAVLGTVINLGIPTIIFTMAADTAAHLDADIRGAKTKDPLPRVQHLVSNKPDGPMVRVEIAEYEITDAGTYIGIKVAPKPLPGALMGLASIPSNFSGEQLGYGVRLPMGVKIDDPALRIRWTVIGPSGTVLVNQDGPAAGRDRFSFSPSSVGPGLSQLGVGVRVYRALGADITDFLNDNIALTIRGPAAPGTYVRWWYDVKNPQVQFDSDHQAWSYTGEEVVSRHSNFHRADRPCKNASKMSRYQYRIDALDALPFPLAALPLHRAELCDYCFYGGPAGLRASL
jgi:hypothetical protein